MEINSGILNIKNLSIGYEKQGKVHHTVFDRINIHARRGELIALIGKNGVGKSTLLKTLARLQKPINGDIDYNSMPFQSIANQDFAKMVGFVSTEIVNVPNLSVMDLVALGRFPYTNWFGRLNSEDLDKLKQALDSVGMLHHSEKKVNEISDGERQRVMIARTLAQDTDLIILDEPTAFLDLSNKYEIVHLLRELSQNQNKTIIFSTHDVHIALREVDKIWLMLDDQIVEGAPEDLIISKMIGKVFDQSKLKFDHRKVDFISHRSLDKKISMEGTGENAIIVKKALDRMNYKVVDQSENTVHLKVIDSPEFKLVMQQDGKEFAFNSVYKLSLFIQ